MRHLLSIVIPTKNRQEYCLEAVKQILGLKMEEVQICIQDNSDEPVMGDLLKGIANEKVIYNYHAGTLSFVDNFSEAISLADGMYICMIGDDDGVLPNILGVVKMAYREHYDAVIPGLNSVYFWPSEHPIYQKAEQGYLCVAYLSAKKKDINCFQGLDSLMEHAGQDYQALDIPRIYHGIVKRETLLKIKNHTGVYFGGLTPDIYMSVVLCFVCKKVCRVGYPITVSGICPRSGSSDSATGKHTGELKDAPHFRGHDSYNWDEKAPAIYSVESIWAETVLQALRDWEADEYYKKFRVDVLDGICMDKYPQFKEVIRKHAEKHGFSIQKVKIIGKKKKIEDFLKRCTGRICRRKNDVKKLYHVPDINSACNQTMKEMYMKNICIKAVKEN